MRLHDSTPFVLAATLLAVACGGHETSASSSAARSSDPGRPLRVVAVNYPLAYFAERIGGEAVEVDLPVPAGVDPAFWKPTADDIGEFQRADLILDHGAGYARWMRTATLPPSRLVDTSRALEADLLEREGAVSHSHGPDGEHSHGEQAFTTWLDLRLALKHAEAVRDALAERLPQAETGLDARFAALSDDLRQIDADWLDARGEGPAPRCFFSHPVYAYLERRLDLDGRSVHWEPDAVPDDTQWRELDDLLETHTARVMLWEGEPRAGAVDGLRELGIESHVFDPCGNRPDQGDFLDVMRANGENLRAALANE